MANLSISGDNSSYTLTLSGMSTSLRYHVFIADLSSSGGINGYKCVRSSKGTSSSWTYNGSSNAPYSNYERGVYVRSTSSQTIHEVGNIYTWSQVFEGTKEVDSGTIPAASGSGGGGGGTTPKKHYYYQVKLYGNGGVFSDGSKTYTTYWWPKDDVASSETTSPEVNTSVFPSPTRNGYKLRGWSLTSDGTPTSYLTFKATSTDADSPTLDNAAYAIWAAR